MREQYPEAYRAFLNSLNKSQHTIKQYVNDAKKFEKYVAKESDCENFSQALHQYVTNIYNDYQTANSINRKLAALRSYCAFLYSRKYIGVYDKTLFELKEIEQTKLNVFTDRQLKIILSKWEDMFEIAETAEHAWLAIRNLAITYTIAQLGIKPAELIKMKWAHIHEEDMQVTILERQTYRNVDITEELIHIWKRYQEETLAYFDSLTSFEYMWVGVGNKLGEPLTVKTIERVFLQLSKLVGFKVTCTTLRYTALEKLMEQYDEKEVVGKLGYARKGVLKERYQRLHQVPKSTL